MSENNATVREFKAWISGIMEAHGTNYCPDAKVWKKILKKIESLPEEKIVLQESTAVEPYTQNFNNGHIVHNTQRQYAPQPDTSSFDQVVAQNYNVTVNPQPTLVMDNIPTVSSGTTVKTPNIDTSISGYKSMFE
jgi:hypothetical protein